MNSRLARAILAAKSQERPIRGEQKYPASQGQEELWNLLQMIGFNALNIHARIKLRQKFDYDQFKKALITIVRRHEILATKLKVEGGTLIHYVEPSFTPALSQITVAVGQIDSCWKKFVNEGVAENGTLWQLAIAETDGDQELFFKINHLIADGWAVSIFFKEFESILLGKINQLPPINSFRSYCEEQHGRLERQSFLSDNSLSVPMKIPGEANTPINGESCYFQIPVSREHQEILNRYCQQNNVTMAVVLMAFWAKLLSTFFTEKKVSFSMLYHGRSEKYLNTIGYFVKLRSIGIDCSNKNISELLTEAKREKDRALNQNDDRFERVSNGYSFNFETNYYNYFDKSEIAEPVELTGQAAGISKIELSGTQDSNGHLCLAMNYCPAIYSPNIIEQLSKLLLRLIDNGTEIEALQPVQPAPTLPPLLQSIYDEVVKNSGAAAVVSDKGQVTYGELWDTSSLWCAKLWSMGLRQGGICATFRPADADQIAIILAIWRLGAAYLPLDYYHHESRLKELDNFGVKVVIRAGMTADTDAEYTENWPKPEDRAYLIMTSGSTGQPKVAQLTHGGLAMQDQAVAELLSATDRVQLALTASLAFDISIWQLTMPLCYGGTVFVLKSVSPLLDVQGLAEELSEYNVEFLELVPSQLSVLLKKAPVLNTLKQVVLIGEKVSKELGQQWLSQYPDIRLWNFYGPSECSIHASACEITTALIDSWPETVLPVGQPLAGATLQVVDENHRRLPPLCPGELLISGPYVGLGYLNNPEQTAKSFKDFGYLTGDLAYETLDGQFVVLGRKDQQIKLRGYRIEIEEIEAALKRYPQVSEAAVTVIGSGDEVELKGLLIAPPSLDGADLYAYLKSQLPDYMIPASFLLVDELPYLPSGKLDRKNLGQLSGTPIQLRVNREPQGLVEEQIADLFREILGLTEVDANTSFFGYGGSSLLLLELRNRIITIFGKEIGVADLFNRNSVAELAELVEKNKKFDNPLIHHNLNEAPASPAQKRFWLLWQTNRDPRLYNSQGAFIFNDKINKDGLYQAISKIIERHILLRTCFAVKDNNLVQMVIPDKEPPLIYRNYSGQLDGEQLARNEVAYLFNQTFDLEEGKTWLFYAAVISHERSIIALNIHHIIEDHASIAIIMQEIQDFYYHTFNKPNLLIDYYDYSVWQNEYLQTKQCKDLQAQYISIINHGCSGNLPGEMVTSDCHNHRLRYSIADSVWKRLNELLNKKQVTFFEFMMTNFAKALAKLSNGQPSFIAFPSQNRDRPELRALVAPLLETLVCVPDCTHHSFDENLEKVAWQMRQIREFSMIPFEWLPKYEVKYFLVEHQEQFGRNKEHFLERIHTYEEDLAKYPITIYLEENNTSPEIILAYRCKQYHAGIMDELFRQIIETIEKYGGKFEEKPSLLAVEQTILPEKVELQEWI